MAKCEKCDQHATVLYNVHGAMLCPLCEAETETKMRQELQKLVRMSEAQFLAWLEEDKELEAHKP
jgi:uncharacterized Zn finger protein (UPF0148 family)